MCFYMYFDNANTHAVTKQDEDLLMQVCIILRTLCFIGGRQKATDSEWRLRQMECHSISKMISLISKDLTLVDGYLIGLELVPGETQVTIVQSNHSWLRTPDGAIIDPYPMGMISTTSALLLPTSGTVYCAHGGNLYHERTEVRNHFNVSECWRNARSCLRSLKKYTRKEDMAQIISGII